MCCRANVVLTACAAHVHFHDGDFLHCHRVDFVPAHSRGMEALEKAAIDVERSAVVLFVCVAMRCVVVVQMTS